MNLKIKLFFQVLNDTYEYRWSKMKQDEEWSSKRGGIWESSSKCSDWSSDYELWFYLHPCSYHMISNFKKSCGFVDFGNFDERKKNLKFNFSSKWCI